MAIASQGSIASHASEEAYAVWQRAVAGVLAKSRKVDVADLPDDPERLLDSTTYDGITVAPLYSALDERPEASLPGHYPYVRGRDPHRDVNSGWKVCVRYGTGEDAQELNRVVLDGLANGVSAVWLTVGSGGIDPDTIADALTGVYLDLAPLTLDAGTDVLRAASALFSMLDDADIGERGAVDLRLGATPLTSRFGGPESIDLADVVELAHKAAAREETVRTVTADGTVFHNLGASDAQELGATVAAGLDYVRALTAGGLTTAQALGQIEFRLAATDDQFQTIAKFRAARVLWARIAQVCGAPEAGDAPQHAVTSEAMMSQRDPWVNMLRTTLASFGAGVGGADSVTVLPFDVALDGGAAGVSKTFAARIARNTQLLLLEEAHLGRVLDPASGSWYVEELTAAIADRAWTFFQQLEACGGFGAAADDGSLLSAIDATRAERDSDIAHRATPLTGVNEFPNLAEAPLPPQPTSTVLRYGRAYEALRDRSDAYLAEHDTRPTVLLTPLGSVAEHNVRTTFASNLLASGGIEAVNPGPLTVEAIEGAVASSGASIAVICGTDTRYAEEAAVAVDALRAAGVTRVLLAGPEKAVANHSSRPDGFLTARVDAVAVLSDLLDTLGA